MYVGPWQEYRAIERARVAEQYQALHSSRQRGWAATSKDSLDVFFSLSFLQNSRVSQGLKFPVSPIRSRSRVVRKSARTAYASRLRAVSIVSSRPDTSTTTTLHCQLERDVLSLGGQVGRCRRRARAAASRHRRLSAAPADGRVLDSVEIPLRFFETRLGVR